MQYWSKQLLNTGIVLLLLFFCSSGFSQSRDSLTFKGKQSHSVLDLINLVAYFQIEKNKSPIEGEYVRGSWEQVKKSKPPKTIYWDYATGVTFLAMQRVFDIVKDQKILKFISDNNRISADQYAYLRWQKNQFGTIYNTEGFGKLWRLNLLDDCGSMGAQILETKLRHNVQFTPNMNALVEIMGNYVTHVQDRLPDSTLWRPVSDPEGPTIWVDDLYMSIPFLIRWAEYKHDPNSLSDAALQVINYAKYLQDTDGTFYHGYYIKEKRHNCCKWGRGNGWASVSMAELLSVLPENHPRYAKVMQIYKNQMKGLLTYQSADGLWNQVIDHPELPWGTETTCSSQFAYAMARGINRGWLDKSYVPVVMKALTGLKSRISAEGGIEDVCKSTSIGDNLEYYNTRINRYDDTHGNGLMLLALTEIYKMENRNK